MTSLWTGTQTLQKRLFKFLLKRTIGQFLETELDMTQLDVRLGLSGGVLNLKHVELKVEALNELLLVPGTQRQMVNARVVSGVVGSITVKIPWRDFWRANCSLEIEGLQIVVETDTVTKSVFGSAHGESLLLSSIQIAEDFRKHGNDYDDEDVDDSKDYASNEKDAGMEGLQVLAHLIDGIMSKIKITAADTAVKIRHTSETTGKTSVLTINIPEMEYHDETPGSEQIQNNDTAIKFNPPILVKNLTLNGFNVEYEEEVTMGEAQDSDDDEDNGDGEVEEVNESDFHDAESGASHFQSQSHFHSMMSSSMMSSSTFGNPTHDPTPQQTGGERPASRRSSLPGQTPTVLLHAGNKDSLKVRLRQPSCTRNVPAVDVDLFLRLCYICITAEQYHFLQELASTLLPEDSSADLQSKPTGSNTHEVLNFKFTEEDIPTSRPMGPADFERVISKHGDDDEAAEGFSQDSFDSVDLSEDEAPKKEKGAPPPTSEAAKAQTNLRFKVHIKDAKAYFFPQPLQNATGNDVLFGTGPVPQSHMKMEMASVKLEYFDATEKQGSEVSIKTLLIHEFRIGEGFVAKGDYFHILSSINPENMPEPLSKKDKWAQLPDIFVRLTAAAGSISHPVNEKKLEVTVKPLLVSIDLQIIDRFFSFISAPKKPRYLQSTQGNDSQAHKDAASVLEEIMNDIESGNSQSMLMATNTKLSITCPLIRVDFLAPRTISTLNWKPQEKSPLPPPKPGYFPSYEETLLVDLYGLSASTQLSSQQPITKFDLTLQSINGFLKEPQKPQKLIAVLDKFKDQLITFHVTIQPPESLLETHTEERSKRKKLKSPNPAKDHESDPMGFQHKTILNSFIFVACEIPVCVANLTKAEFDVADTLFNEISEWEPKGDGTGMGNDGYTTEVYAPCTSDGEDFDEETDTVASEQVVQVETNKPKYSLFSLSADLSTLSVTLHENQRPNSDFLSLSPVCSYQFCCSKLRSFKVNGYKGSNMNYISLDIEHFVLFDVTNLTTYITDDPHSLDLGKDLESQLLPNEMGLKKVPILHRTRNAKIAPSDMLSVRLTITRDLEMDMKEVVANIHFNQVALKHVVGSDWLGKVMDLVEEPDMPGLGHDFAAKFSKVVVVVSNVSIDYKPLYAPWRAVVFAEEFKVSTNVIPGSPLLGIDFSFTNPCVYFINEVAYLSVHQDLALQRELKNPRVVKNEWTKHWELLGFTKLMEADLIQLTLRRTKAIEQFPHPKMELSFKFGQVTLHTRPDSFVSLTDAINYYLDGLDLRPLIKEPLESASQEHLRQDRSMEGDDEDELFQNAEDNAPHDLLASVDETMFGNPIPVKEKLQMFAQQARNHEEFTDITHDHETMDFVEGFYPAARNSIIEPVHAKPSDLNLLASYAPSTSSSSSSRNRNEKAHLPQADSLEDLNMDVYVDEDMIDGGGTWDGMTEYEQKSAPGKGKGKGKGNFVNEPRDYLSNPGGFGADLLSRVPGPDVWVSDDPEDIEPTTEQIPWDAPPDIEDSSSLDGFAAEDAPDEIVRILEEGSLSFKEDYFSAPTKGAPENEPEIKAPRDLPANKIMAVKVQITKVVWNLCDTLEWESNRDEEKGIRTKRTPLGETAEMKTEGEARRKGSKPQDFEEVDTPLFRHVSMDEGLDFNENAEEGFSEQDDSLNLSDSIEAGEERELPKADVKPEMKVEEFDQFAEIETEEFWDQYSKDASNTVDARNRALKPRSNRACLELKFDGVVVEFDEYPTGLQYASRLLVLVKDVKVLDHIETSNWRTFMTYSSSESNPRESGSNMVHFEITKVRPDPQDPAEEARMKIKLLPLRLHIDQDAFEFVRWFFSYESPIAAQKARKQKNESKPKPVEPTFFQQVEIKPISLKIDYKPKMLNIAGLAEGKIEELGNIFQLEGAEVNLIAVKLNGVTGWNKLIEGMVATWKPHLNSQIAGVASGVAPVRSFVNLSSAALDLFIIPVQQYHRDGRFVYGFQKAASSFLKTATVETINIGTKILVGTQVILVAVDSTLSENPGPSREGSIYSNQPSNLSEGLQLGYTSLSANFSSAAHTLFHLPAKAYQSRGAQGAVQTALKSIPSAVLRPVIGATQAVSQTLFGIRNSLNPGIKQEQEEKYGPI